MVWELRLGIWVPKVARGDLGVGIWGYGIGGVRSEGQGTRGLESDVWSWRSLVCGRGSADWDLEILGSRTRKLRAGVEEAVLRAWPLRNIVLQEARATFWHQFLGLDCGVRKWCFRARSPRFVATEVVKIRQFLKPARQNTR